MFTVYAIVSDTGKVYIGQTNNIEDRLKRHNGEMPFSAKSYTHKQGKNWKVVHTENFLRRQEALVRERQLKSYRGRQYIKQLIKSKRS